MSANDTINLFNIGQPQKMYSIKNIGHNATLK